MNLKRIALLVLSFVALIQTSSAQLAVSVGMTPTYKT